MASSALNNGNFKELVDIKAVQNGEFKNGVKGYTVHNGVWKEFWTPTDLPVAGASVHLTADKYISFGNDLPWYEGGVKPQPHYPDHAVGWNNTNGLFFEWDLTADTYHYIDIPADPTSYDQSDGYTTMFLYLDYGFIGINVTRTSDSLYARFLYGSWQVDIVMSTGDDMVLKVYDDTGTLVHDEIITRIGFPQESAYEPKILCLQLGPTITSWESFERSTAVTSFASSVPLTNHGGTYFGGTPNDTSYTSTDAAPGTEYPWDGAVHEFVHFNRQLTATERNSMFDYFDQKYGGLQFSHEEMNFDPVQVGQSGATERLAVTNITNNTLYIDFTDYSGADFEVTDVAGASIDGTEEIFPDDSFFIDVTFTPATSGDHNNFIEITWSSLDPVPVIDPPKNIRLKGSALEPVSPIISTSTSSITYADTDVGSTATQNVTVNNDGDVGMTITTSFTGTDASQFTTPDIGTYTIAAGGSMTISITFQPTTSGAKTASFDIAHDAGNTSSPVSIALSGNAITVEAPEAVPGLVQWVDVNDLTGLAEGDPVTSFTDRAGVNWNASAGTTAPVYRENYQNGKPAIDSSTADRWLESDPTPRSDIAEWTYFLVMDYVDIGGYTIHTSFNFPADTNAPIRLDQSGGSLLRHLQRDTAGNWEYNEWGNQTAGYVGAGTNIFTLRQDTSGLGLRSWKNGGYNDYIGTTSTQSYTGDMTTKIFDRADSVSSNVQELIVYDRSLTDEEIQDIEIYLSGKYNITVAHPLPTQPAASGVPTTIPDITFWFDASKETSSDIRGLSDWSGNGLNALIDNGTPAITSNWLNNQPAFYFDGNTWYDILNEPLFNTNEFTYFVVAETSNADTTRWTIRTDYGDGASGNSQYMYGMFQNNTGVNFGTHGRDLSGGWHNFAAHTHDNIPHIITSQFDGSVDTGWHYDGLTLMGSDSGGVTMEPNLHKITRIGATPNFSGQEWMGNIAEVIFYHRSLTQTEREDVINYLKNKYAL